MQAYDVHSNISYPPSQATNSSGSVTFTGEKRRWTIPLHYLVFIQTFLVAFCVVSIPLLISFAGTNTSNNLSTDTARNLANSLAGIIQGQASDVVEVQVAKIFADTEEIILQYRRLVKTGLTFADNYDEMYRIFFAQQRELGPIQMIYYATDSDSNFFGIQSDILPGSNETIMYLGYAMGNATAKPSKCSICPSLRSSNTAFYFNIFPSSGIIQANNITHAYPYVSTKQSWYLNAKKANGSNVVWTSPYVFGSRDKIGITGSLPIFDSFGNLHGVMGVDISLESLTFTLQQLSTTKNGFIYIMTSNGQLIGSSSNETKTKRGSLLNATDVNDKFISVTARFLNSLVNNTSNFASLGTYGNYVLPQMFFQHKVLKSRPSLIIVTGAPRTDYVGDIDNVQVQLKNDLRTNMLKVILISIAMFVILVTLALLASWILIARPLREISTIMDEASQFDFSSLKGLLERNPTDNSFIREFESIQFSFLVMFKKFADAIKNSRQLWRDYENSLADRSGGNTYIQSP